MEAIEYDRPIMVAIFQDPAIGLVDSNASSDLNRALSQGPMQPRNVAFNSTTVIVSGKLKTLKFQESWYDGRHWLEYSVTRDEASCFYCRLFKPQVKGRLTGEISRSF